MSDSIQHKLDRVRPPRVQITYDVETGGALERKEIPFIVGILADLSGKSETIQPPLRDRKIVQIDRDNFSKVLEAIAPKITFEVPNLIPKGKSPLTGSITFTHIDHFDPVAVVQRIPALNKIYEERSQLRDFLAKMDGNDSLNTMLETALANKDSLAAWKSSFDPVIKELDTANDIADPKERETAVSAALAKIPQDKDSDVDKLIYDGQILFRDDHDEKQKAYALLIIAQFVNQLIIQGELLPPPAAKDEDPPEINVAGLITKRMAQKDKIISNQLNLVMHYPDFQAMEASWRGLHFLVINTETNEKLKLKLLNVTQDELLKDLDKAVEFDQSALFKKIYENEYGTYGGEPYSVLVGDYEFGRLPNDIKLLNLISGVAAAAHAPFITAAYAKLFDLEDFSKLYKPRDLSKIFESAELIKWRSFRESEDSRYVTLTLPRVLLRLPYNHETNPVEGIVFDEDVNMPLMEKGDNGELQVKTEQDANGITFEQRLKKVEAKKLLWGNSAYALAQRITNAFALYGWTAAIRGVEGGGLVADLPAYTFETEDGDIALTCPTEVAITDRREKELNDLGFMAICHCKGTDKAAFFGGQTTNKPKSYLTDSATANARISAMLPYILAASRFAHYIKVIMREKIGSFLTRANVEDYLNTWIAQYVLLDDSPPQDIKAKYPLREARIEVTDVPGKPGCYRATVFLKPHFQLEELTTSIRLVAELPS